MTSVIPERDPEFYFDDSLVVIQVENTLFKVHRYHLIKSETFSDMFKMPKGPSGVLEEGASPEHPIVLNGVKSSDFRALLKVLYTVHYTNLRPNFDPDIIVPAFRLAHMWNFSDLRDHLLPLVKDSLGGVDKIVLARELGIQEWLVPAHVELCQRTESLNTEEVRKLGVDSTVKIFQLREQSLLSQLAPNSECVQTYCHSCGVNWPVYGNHGSGDCRKCDRHINSGERYYRFPVFSSSTTAPSSVPSLGSVWVYCGSCGGNGPVFGTHGATANCHRCDVHISSSTQHYRFVVTPPSTAPLRSNVGIESELKKWVEGGCVTK